MLPSRRTALASSLPWCLRSTALIIYWTSFPRLQKRSISIPKLDSQRDNRERIVVLGSGWAGFTLARGLDSRKYQVVVVSPRSYFVFTPLLARLGDDVDFEKKTLTVEESVDDPLQGRALASDRQEDDTRSQHPAAERPKVEKGKLFDLRWDKLVIAVGCYSQTFKTKGVKENAYFLKDVGDARKIRNRLLSCFEAAALPTTSVEMKKLLLNFAVVGGGPTGIEWSAELHDLINEDMKKLYPDLMKYVNITVYDVASKVLSMFDDRLSKFAMEHFNREGINIQPNHHVEELRQGLPGSINDQTGATHCYTLKLKEEGEIGIGMCVWSTGLMMNPYIKRALAGKLQRHPESRGILINDRLQATDEGGQAQGDVYAIGDCATVESATYPATAQVDSQQASWLAKRLNTGDIEEQVFTYKNLGVMAYVGNWNAILQSEGGDVSGRLAWIIWRSAYLVKSLSWRNRILIPVYWFINWVFGRDISRF